MPRTKFFVVNATNNHPHVVSTHFMSGEALKTRQSILSALTDGQFLFIHVLRVDGLTGEVSVLHPHTGEPEEHSSEERDLPHDVWSYAVNCREKRNRWYVYPANPNSESVNARYIKRSNASKSRGYITEDAARKTAATLNAAAAAESLSPDYRVGVAL